MKTFYDYFTIQYGQKKYHSKSFLEEHPGNIPLISSSGTNNGLYGFYNIKPTFKHVISVPSTGSIALAFYHGYSCCIDDNCLVLTPKAQMTLEEMIYMCLLIRKNKYRFMYGRQVTPDRLGNIPIPDIPNYTRDFQSENFEKAKEPLIKSAPPLLNEKEWSWFVINDLFEIKKGKRLTKFNMTVGETPYVGAIEANNGYRQFISHTPIHEANTISVNYNGSVGEAFYQPKPYWATDDVNVLYPKFPMNQFIALFICSVIKKEKFRFNYGRKWHVERMKISRLKLPVDSQGKPNYKFMEDYIKSLPFSSHL